MSAGTVRVLRHGKGGRAWNMAVDEALLRLSAAPVVRVYGWTEPAVSIGYFQDAALAPAGRPWVRRWTGGGLVDHAADTTYTVVLPKGHELDAAGTAESYRRIHEGVARALAACGVDCALAADCAPAAAACFAGPVRFDVVGAGGLKLAGAAQRRGRAGTLHQGSVLVAPRPDGLEEALAREVAAVLGGAAELAELTADEAAEAARLERERYGTEAWNLRREALRALGAAAPGLQ